MNSMTGNVVLFMPAYFAERTLANVHAKIPKGFVDEIFLVDDASKDGIEQVAKSLGIHFYRNRQNLGYGGNIKVCLQKALERNANIIIELHPDDQYDPTVIPAALNKLQEGYDFVMGSRFLESGAALRNKMPLWKYSINRLSTTMITSVLGVHLTEFHCGFRVYTRRFLEAVNYQKNDNDYVFSFQIITQACAGRFKIAEIPVTCRYFPGATQISFRKTIRYGAGVLKTLFLYIFSKFGKKHSMFLLTHSLPETIPHSKCM